MEPSQHSQGIIREVSFTVVATPVPQPRQKYAAVEMGGIKRAIGFVEKENPIHELKKMVRDAARAAMGETPLIEGPIHLGLSFVISRPKSMTKKRGENPRIPCSKRKGDIDNFSKAIMDALNRIVWADDCQVYSLFATKEFAADGEGPHTLVVVQEMGAPHG